MKILVSCPQCSPKDEGGNAAVLEISNDNAYRVTCDHGHVQSISLPQQRYEILFEIGARAIVDGYYREAVSSFAASLERYYEFFLRVTCMSGADFDKPWKLISAQSERQLGAYVIGYFMTYGRPPKILSDERAKFRNSVIHKGHIPSREQAVSFGEVVAELIRDGSAQLLQGHHSQVMEMIRRTMLPEGRDGGARFHIPATFFNLTAGVSEKTLPEHLASLLTHNQPRY